MCVIMMHIGNTERTHEMAHTENCNCEHVNDIRSEGLRTIDRMHPTDEDEGVLTQYIEYSSIEIERSDCEQFVATAKAYEVDFAEMEFIMRDALSTPVESIEIKEVDHPFDTKLRFSVTWSADAWT